MTKIKKPSEISVNSLLKTLIYGQPGIGKSTLALSFPNPLMIDCDRGVHRIAPEHLTDTVEVNSWTDIDEVLNEDLKNYQTLVFDTAGKLIDFMTDHLVRINPKFAQADGTFSLKGYGARKIMFQTLLRRIHISGKHVVFVAHEREEKDNETRFVRPEIGGSSGNDLIKELDLVGYMEAVGKKRTIHFSPQERFYAKNSLNLPEAIPVPDTAQGNTFMQGIVEKYNERLVERQIQGQDYIDLIDIIENNLEAVSGIEKANEMIEWNKNIHHIWDSKLRFAVALKKKADELGLVFSKEKGIYLKKDGNE